MNNRFANIFNMTEAQAITILQTPREEFKDGSDRYIAASQLVKFPSEHSINALIEAIKNDDDELDNRIVRRKALESLGRLKAAVALPVMQSCLGDDDCYIVENAVWAIGEIGTDDIGILDAVAQVLERPNQSYRVIIHKLAQLNYTPALERIRPFMENDDKSIASAATATVCRFTEDYSPMESVMELLQDTSVTARRACIQDLIDANYYQAIPKLAQCPVSMVFRLRGIRLLAETGIPNGNLTFANIEPYLDQTILDHPSTIEMVHEYDASPSIEFLINELYETDLGRCYLATQTLLELYPEQAPDALMVTFKEKAHNDYGGHYHVMKLFGWLQYAPAFDILVNDALNNLGPQFQKSRTAAAIALGDLGDARAIPLLKEQLETPIWSLQYACLLALKKLREPIPPTFAADNPDFLVGAKAERLK